MQTKRLASDIWFWSSETRVRKHCVVDLHYPNKELSVTLNIFKDRINYKKYEIPNGILSEEKKHAFITEITCSDFRSIHTIIKFERIKIVSKK